MANYGDYYKLGLYEKAFPTGLCFDQMLDETHIFGFDWLEISIDETDYRLKRLYWSNLEKQQLTNTVKQSGVPIRTMCLSGHRKYPLGSHDARIRELSLEIMKRAIDFICKELQVPCFNLQAQAHLTPFYERLGLKICTDICFCCNASVAASIALSIKFPRRTLISLSESFDTICEL